MVLARGKDEGSWWSRHRFIATIVANVVVYGVVVEGLAYGVFSIPWKSDEAAIRAMVFGGLALLPLAVLVARVLGLRIYFSGRGGRRLEVTVGGMTATVVSGGACLAVLFASEGLSVPFWTRGLVASIAGSAAVVLFIWMTEKV